MTADAQEKPSPVPTPKVAASTAAVAVVALVIGLVEWLVPTDVPARVEDVATTVAVFGAGWFAARDWGGGGKRVRH